MSLILIGLGHKARQGKNYVADYMKAEDNRVKTYAFADELKLYCKEHHDQLVPQWQLWHTTKQYPVRKDDPIYGYTPILQWYGTEIARKQDPDTWVKALDARIKKEIPEVAVITDVRFSNEAEYIKKAAGYLVKVVRLNSDGTQWIDPGRDAKHPSETALNDYQGWDFELEVQDGDLEILKKYSVGVLHAIKAYESGVLIYDAAGELGQLYGFNSIDTDSDSTGFKS